MDILQKDLHQLEKWQEEWEMSFNPAKCSVMKLSTKKEAPDRSYNFCGQPLQEVDSHPYLGVEIDSKMSWKAQYQKLTSKANKVLGFLKRNLWFCPREMKETAYKTLVRPILEYAGCSWDPYKKKDIVAIEAVQRKAARFCMNDYKQLSSVTEMTRVLGWEALQDRRKDARLQLMYRIMNGEVGIRAEDYVHQGGTAGLKTRGNSRKLKRS
ncbi:uncharacterized protein [Amphiura filiformis]|uniref:uncharacterized protein n=1 Tax=Amphiura filiformis TaxID=82378 RepID=UPI003B227030